MNLQDMIIEAAELLRCAAEGSFDPADADAQLVDTRAPSLLLAIEAMYGEEAEGVAAGVIGGIAFRALGEVDPEYGEGFADLYDGELEEGMRHAFLEAATRLEASVGFPASTRWNAQIIAALSPPARVNGSSPAELADVVDDVELAEALADAAPDTDDERADGLMGVERVAEVDYLAEVP